MKMFSNSKSIKTFGVMSALLFSLSGCASFIKSDDETTTEDTPVERVSLVQDITENTLQLNSNGTLMEISCEDYSDQGIDINGLEDYIKAEIDAYNNENGLSKMSLVEYQEENGFVKTAIQYSDINTYNDFNLMDIMISLYDKEEADEVAQEEAKARLEAAQAAQVVVEETEIDEEALAEAGYSLDDIEEGAIAESSGDVATATDAVATFTDASGNISESSDISSDTYMMVKTSEPIVVEVVSGKVLYTNYHAEMIDASSARVLGDGEAIIIYEYSY
ncbi:MAG: hypothetical protein K6E10_12275 [Eubacterium sp.]|nr:hypothetical protein [Eubacterium sp.]